MTYYFAYGSLMDLDFMRALGVYPEKAQSGILKNHQFITNIHDEMNLGYGYANIIKKENYTVEGVLMQIRSESLSYLDAYEGYPLLYRRDQLEVYLKESPTKIVAWVYIGLSNHASTKNLLLSDSQKQKISNGFRFLSKPYQRYLSNFLN